MWGSREMVRWGHDTDCLTNRARRLRLISGKLVMWPLKIFFFPINSVLFVRLYGGTTPTVLQTVQGVYDWFPPSWSCDHWKCCFRDNFRTFCPIHVKLKPKCRENWMFDWLMVRWGHKTSDVTLYDVRFYSNSSQVWSYFCGRRQMWRLMTLVLFIFDIIIMLYI